MEKSREISAIFANFQKWVDDRLAQYAGRNYHWALSEYGGFCPPYLGRDLGFGPGILPKHKGGKSSNDVGAHELEPLSPWPSFNAALDSSVVPFPLGAWVIQQIKEEIYEFVEVLLQNGKLDNMLEIGLGQYGGTHVLFSQFFESVITIDSCKDLVDVFARNHDPEKYKSILVYSKIIVADSQAIDISKFSGRYDCLFIDGTHTYDACRADHRKFGRLVVPGGIVAFHDTHDRRCTSADYVDSLRDQFDIKDIWHPDGFGGGISYYIK